MEERVVTRYADAKAVLSDPRYAVPPVRGDAAPRTLAWLRQMVCRFSEGEAHQRRRAIVERELAHMDLASLRRQAQEQAETLLDPAAPIASVARPVPIRVLGHALGVNDLDTLVKTVPVAAAVYLTGTEHPSAADAAIATLVDLLGPGPGEAVANRIAILTQACDATAALIGNAVALAHRLPDAQDTELIIYETLRLDPPIPFMRRVATEDIELDGCPIAAGSPITLDLKAAGPEHLIFGVGRRPCPGADHALQLAAGVIDTILRRTEKEATR